MQRAPRSPDQPSHMVRRELSTVPPASQVLRGSLRLNVGEMQSATAPATNVTYGSISAAIEAVLGGEDAGSVTNHWYFRILKVVAFGLPSPIGAEGRAGNTVPYCKLQAYSLALEDYGSLAFVANVGIIPPIQLRDTWIPVAKGASTVVASGVASLVQVTVEVIASVAALPTGVAENVPQVVLVQPAERPRMC